MSEAADESEEQEQQFESTSGLLSDQGSDSDTTQEQTTCVDWDAIWQEFGFDSPDADGNQWASRTQLIGAIQCSEQQVAGDATGHITDACEDGTLEVLTTSGGATRGYVLEVSE